MVKEYLEQIISLFVQKDRRDRFRTLLGSERRYNDFLEGLLRDPRYFDPRCILKIPPSDQTLKLISRRLVEIGVRGPAYIVCTDSDFDGAESNNVESALERIVCTQSESLIFFPSVSLGYYEGHEGWRYILRKVT